jgi:hypothetical protein
MRERVLVESLQYCDCCWHPLEWLEDIIANAKRRFPENPSMEIGIKIYGHDDLKEHTGEEQPGGDLVLYRWSTEGEKIEQSKEYPHMWEVQK